MSVIDLLLNKDKWKEFLEYKLTKSHLSKVEEQNLIEYINHEKFLEVASSIVNGTYTFSIPKKVFINKSGTNKKRAIYTFDENENIILKFILFCMSKYDAVFCSNCFSFRKNLTIKHAIFTMLDKENIDSHYAYKVDIQNYFNSINVDKLLPMLKSILRDDNRLFALLENLLRSDKAMVNGEVVCEKCGVMAGTPISTFLANVYLSDLDEYFWQNNIHYARYSDDIIVFAESIEKLEEYKQYIYSVIGKKDLTINPSKESIYLPHQPWHFLGFEYCNGIIDLSDVTVQKIKAKIRRKARALYRWKIRNNKTTEHTIKVMIRVFNNKFYREFNTKDLTWCKWFFPTITSTKKLSDIDKYLVQYMRYLSTGKFSKTNYKISYAQLKSLGYKSLVNEYYKYRKK